MIKIEGVENKIEEREQIEIVRKEYKELSGQVSELEENSEIMSDAMFRKLHDELEAKLISLKNRAESL